MKALYKTIATIWTEYDPTESDPQLMDLRFHAEYEFVHCSRMKCIRIAEPDKDPDWDAAAAFSDFDDDEDPSADPDDPGEDI